jgi:hypothetical protein
MKILPTLLISLILTACGTESLVVPEGTNNIKKGNGHDCCCEDESPPNYGNTVTRISCRRDYVSTTFKYILIRYPNGDADAHCSIQWFNTSEMRHASGSRFAEHGACFLMRSATEYWTFSLNSVPKAEWNGMNQETDHMGTKLPYSIQFDLNTCKHETWEDIYWWEAYYPFNADSI